MQALNNPKHFSWLKEIGLNTIKEVYWQLTVPELVEHAIRNKVLRVL